MNLNKYLEALRTCPDELVEKPKRRTPIHKLTSEFGIYDNYHIFLKREIEIVKNDLVALNYLLLPSVKLSPGLAELYAGITFHQFYNSEKTVWFEIETPRKQESIYATIITLHPPTPKVINPKDLVKVILDLGEYIKRERIPAHFPNSMGWDHPKARSRIVCYEPK